MKKASRFAALGLAVALLALGSNSASADHCNSGYRGHGSYYGSSYGTGYHGSSYYGGTHTRPTYHNSGYRSYSRPTHRSYSPHYGGSYNHGHSHYRSGYSYGAGFGTRSNLFIPGFIGG